MTFKEAKELFDKYVKKTNKFACHWVDSEQHWYVCAGVILYRNNKEADMPVTPYEEYPVPPQLLKNPSLVYPENFLEKERLVGISTEFLDIICSGSDIISLMTGGRALTILSLPIKHHKFTEQLPDNTVLNLCFYKGNKNPVLGIEYDEGEMWVAYEHIEVPEDITVELVDGKYKPVQWNDKEKCYKKLRKEKKMLETEKLVKDVLNVDLKGMKFDPNKPGKENDGTQGVTMEEAAKAIAQESPAEVATAEKPAAEAPVEVPKEEPVKRTRKKAETTPVNDLTKVIEQLSGAVPELSAEDAMKALRQLRDLQLAASRRAANISLQYIEATQGVAAKLAAIKAAL